jgi:hypothetical protein
MYRPAVDDGNFLKTEARGHYQITIMPICGISLSVIPEHSLDTCWELVPVHVVLQKKYSVSAINNYLNINKTMHVSSLAQFLPFLITLFLSLPRPQ